MTAASSPPRSLPPRDCDEIAHDLAQRGRQAAAAAVHLARLREHQRVCTSGLYRVFRIAATRQFVVLRDVAAVDGADFVHECADFTGALAWTNQQLTAELAANDRP